MDSLVSFRRKLDSLVLEEVKQQAKQSWLSSQTMPTEIVDALVIEVEQLRARFNRAHCRVLDLEQALNAGWEQERLRIQKAEAEIEQLRRGIHDERVRRDEWEKMYNQAIAGTKVGWPQTELAKTQAELVQTNIERIAETRAATLWTGIAQEREQELEATRAKLVQTEQCHRAALTLARNRGDRLEKAEPLAALVTPELAALLEQLAFCDLPNTFGDPYASRRCARARKAARALAAQIREALEEKNE